MVRDLSRRRSNEVAPDGHDQADEPAPTAHYARALADIAVDLASVIDTSQLLGSLRSRVATLVRPDWIEIFARKPGLRDFFRLDGAAPYEPVATGDAADRLEALLSRREPAFVPGPGDDPLVAGAALVVPMMQGDVAVGAFLLGPRGSESTYPPEDRDFLVMLSRIASAMIGRGPLLEERAAREQLALVGSAASALVHEVKNTLSTVRSAAAVLRRRLGDDPRAHELTQIVETEVERLRDQMVDVLAWVRPSPHATVPVELNTLVAALLRTVDADFRTARVEMAVGLAEPDVTVAAHPDRLRLALLNLLVNAREAMPRGGRIRVAIERPPSPGDGIDSVDVVVEDTGPGIPPESLDRIFEPRFTTKRFGAGLGLANVRRIVEEIGGQVRASNRDEGGARFVIRLPAGATRPPDDRSSEP